jgi:hypothetical protein
MTSDPGYEPVQRKVSDGERDGGKNINLRTFPSSLKLAERFKRFENYFAMENER